MSNIGRSICDDKFITYDNEFNEHCWMDKLSIHVPCKFLEKGSNAKGAKLILVQFKYPMKDMCGYGGEIHRADCHDPSPDFGMNAQPNGGSNPMLYGDYGFWDDKLQKIAVSDLKK